jgi:hypothetical protein
MPKRDKEKQIHFSQKLASILPVRVDNEVLNDKILSYETNVSSYIEFGKEEPSIKNIKVLLKNIFFAPILKHKSDFNLVWAIIDATKLVASMSSIVALLKHICKRGEANRSLLVTNKKTDGSSVEKEELDLRPGITPKDFPVLNHFCIPLETFWMNGLLRYILKLSKSVTGSAALLNFKQENDCEVTLVPIPKTGLYYHFERNMKDHSWFGKVLGALSNAPETSLSWLLMSLSKLHNEELITAAKEASWLIVEWQSNGFHVSKTAMWEEANINC